MTRVRWSYVDQTGKTATRTGEPMSVIRPDEAPALPAGVSKYRRRFRVAPSSDWRMLVRVSIDGKGDLYFAPHVASLEKA